MSNAVKRLSGVGIAIAVVLGGVLSYNEMFVSQDAREILVIQSPISGELTVSTDPGLKYRGFGKVTSYPRRSQFSFSAVNDQGNTVDESVQTRFNDGGHGNISGTMNWAMPLAPESVVQIHRDFGSVEAIEQQLIRTSIQKVIYNVGPTMSSTESSAERRPEIPKFIDDQLQFGPYMTKTETRRIKDDMTDKDRTINVVTIATDDKGVPIRESHSLLAQYKLQIQPVSINGIKYDDVVERQIKQRQESTTQVQIAIANSKRAEQDALTAAKEGEAAATKAKWEQEVIKAKEVTIAEQKLEVASLAAREAEQYKREQILRGEGDAQAKALRMNADGALDAKLEAYVQINAQYADAIKNAQPGAWTPAVVMGGNPGQASNSAQSLMDMFAAKTAKELGVDMTVITKGKSQQ